MTRNSVLQIKAKVCPAIFKTCMQLQEARRFCQLLDFI
tara:strand:+ start:165 stop:278 length:114 start_codon:yes stop_codon:yes gene_type:complete